MLELKTLIQYLSTDVKYLGETIYTQTAFLKDYTDKDRIEIEVEQYHNSNQFSYILIVTLESATYYKTYRLVESCDNNNVHELPDKIEKARNILLSLLKDSVVQEDMLIELGFTPQTFIESVFSDYMND